MATFRVSTAVMASLLRRFSNMKIFEKGTTRKDSRKFKFSQYSVYVRNWEIGLNGLSQETSL